MGDDRVDAADGDAAIRDWLAGHPAHGGLVRAEVDQRRNVFLVEITDGRIMPAWDRPRLARRYPHLYVVGDRVVSRRD